MLRYRKSTYRLTVVGVCLAPFAAALSETVADSASSEPASFNSREFRAPAGFGNYAWNTPLGKVSRLESEPVYVRVAYSTGKVVYFDGHCYDRFIDKNDDGVIGPLADTTSAMLLCREKQGEGYYALAEYFVNSQGFRIGDENIGKAVLFPVTYQFCAQWNSVSNNFQGDPLEKMGLCGVRLHFRSDTAAQAQATLDQSHQTAYERILKWLIKSYGPPEGYDPKGVILVQGWEQEQDRELPAKLRYKTEYWCRPTGKELVPNCSASIVLSFDAGTGQGQLIFLTPPVWIYAHARQFGASDGDPLYRVLHGGRPQPKVRHQCVDSFLCRPSPPKAMPKEMFDRFRLSARSQD